MVPIVPRRPTISPIYGTVGTIEKSHMEGGKVVPLITLPVVVVVDFPGIASLRAVNLGKGSPMPDKIIVVVAFPTKGVVNSITLVEANLNPSRVHLSRVKMDGQLMSMKDRAGTPTAVLGKSKLG